MLCPRCPTHYLGVIAETLPLTRNDYENHSLRLFFAITSRDFVLSTCPGNKDILKELRVRFIIFPEIIVSEYFFASNNFVSEGMFAPLLFFEKLRFGFCSPRPHHVQLPIEI